MKEKRTPFEIEKQIKRASNWNQLFVNETERITAVDQLFQSMEAAFAKNNLILVPEETDLSVLINQKIVLLREDPSFPNRLEIEHLNNGNIRYSDLSGIDEVSPEIGNISHPYTQSLIDWWLKVSPKISPADFERETEEKKVFIDAYGDGRIALKQWETACIKEGMLPQRIGLFIYPNKILEHIHTYYNARHEKFAKD